MTSNVVLSGEVRIHSGVTASRDLFQDSDIVVLAQRALTGAAKVRSTVRTHLVDSTQIVNTT